MLRWLNTRKWSSEDAEKKSLRARKSWRRVMSNFFCFLPFPKQRNLWLSLERREQINELFILRLFPSFSFWLTINTYSFISFLSYPFVLHFPPTVRAVHTEWMCYKGKLLFIAFHFGTNCINFEWMTLKINCSIQKRGTSVSEEKSIFCKKLK